MRPQTIQIDRQSARLPQARIREWLWNEVFPIKGPFQANDEYLRDAQVFSQSRWSDTSVNMFTRARQLVRSNFVSDVKEMMRRYFVGIIPHRTAQDPESTDPVRLAEWVHLPSVRRLREQIQSPRMNGYAAHWEEMCAKLVGRSRAERVGIEGFILFSANLYLDGRRVETSSEMNYTKWKDACVAVAEDRKQYQQQQRNNPRPDSYRTAFHPDRLLDSASDTEVDSIDRVIDARDVDDVKRIDRLGQYLSSSRKVTPLTNPSLSTRESVRESVRESSRGSPPQSGRGSTLQLGRGSVLQPGRGSPPQSSRGSVLQPGRGSVLQPGRGSVQPRLGLMTSSQSSRESIQSEQKQPRRRPRRRLTFVPNTQDRYDSSDEDSDYKD